MLKSNTTWIPDNNKKKDDILVVCVFVKNPRTSLWELCLQYPVVRDFQIFKYLVIVRKQKFK